MASLFRELSTEEEQEFRAIARANYSAFLPIIGYWHPVYQDECVKINREAAERNGDHIHAVSSEAPTGHVDRPKPIIS